MKNFYSAGLTKKPSDFLSELQQLEKITNHTSHDIKLYSKIMGHLAQKLRYIGLDPVDTSNHELYETLKSNFSSFDQQLTKELRTLAASKVSAEGSLGSGIELFLTENTQNFKIYALKSSYVKGLLRLHKPRETMKRLRYKSLDSMLKRENLATIMVLINYLEKESYLNSFYKEYYKAHSSNFEIRDFKIIYLQSDNQNLVKDILVKSNNLSLVCYELGTIILFPIGNVNKSGITTYYLATVIDKINNLLRVSAYLKFNQVNPKLGSKLYEITEKDPSLGYSFLNQEVSWRLIYDGIVRFQTKFEFEHFNSSDFKQLDPIDLLSRLVSGFNFYQGTSYLAKIDKQSHVSLNLLDVAINCITNNSLSNSIDHYFKQSLHQAYYGTYLNTLGFETILNSDLNE